MWIFIRPTDVWLFRDGRPFSAGDHRATSLFPPTPFTLQGAVRAKVLLESKAPLDDYAYASKEEITGREENDATRRVVLEIGSPSNGYGRLKLRGPIVARDGQPPIQFFPTPADVVKVSWKPELIALQPLEHSPFISDLSDRLLPLWTCLPNAEAETDVHWLREDEMRDYLSSQTITEKLTKVERRLFERESRFHVRIDSAVKRPHQDEETGGHLFLVEFIRPCEDAGLLLEVGTEDGRPLDGFPASGMLQLGGEARSAFYKEAGAITLPDSGIREETLHEGKFKVVFITPAYFKNGEQPERGDWSKYFHNAKVTLRAVARGRTQPIGGAKADLKSQRGDSFQKATQHFVPAGSVYYFEADGPVNYDNCPITETPDGDNFGQIGFGQTLIGRWSYVPKECDVVPVC
jgi:CRISPR-associated protein Cmr3